MKPIRRRRREDRGRRIRFFSGEIESEICWFFSGGFRREALWHRLGFGEDAEEWENVRGGASLDGSVFPDSFASASPVRRQLIWLIWLTVTNLFRKRFRTSTSPAVALIRPFKGRKSRFCVLTVKVNPINYDDLHPEMISNIGESYSCIDPAVQRLQIQFWVLTVIVNPINCEG